VSGLPSQLDGVTLVFGVAMLVAAVALLFMLATALSGDHKRMRRRLARINGDGAASIVGANSPTLRRDTVDSSFKLLDTLIKRLPQPAKFRARLAATVRKISAGEYLLASVLVGGATYEGLALFGFGPVSILVGIGTAILLPHMVISFMIKRRALRFVMLLPEAIDLIVRGLRSGLPITESMKVVSQEIPDPVGTEFRHIIESFGFGMTLEESLWATARRIAIAEFNFFAISLSVQQETGGNLTETLDNLADILRRRKQLKLKIRAITGEARASAAILGGMPFAMFGILMLVRPEYMDTMLTTHQGNVMLGGGLFSIVLGIGSMIKMTKFEI
jgi:tight adherence protein B